MKMLVIGGAAQTHALFDGLAASRLWDVTFCADEKEAAELMDASGETFDYVLLEPGAEAPSQPRLAGGGDSRPPAALQPASGSATVVPLDWRRGAQVRSGRGVYGFYSLPPDPERGAAEGAEQWVLEYHAPCRRAGR